MSIPILLCAPDEVFAADLVRTLARDLDVVPLGDVASVADSCRHSLPVAVVLPMSWPSGDSPTLEFLRAFGRRTAAVVYGGRLPAAVVYQALAAGAARVLAADAPGFAEDLRRLLAEVVHDKRLRMEDQQALARLFAEFGLAGASADMQEVFRRALKGSHFRDLPVLISGPPGSPRGRLAAAIHSFDPKRGRRPFFSLDCADLARVLADAAEPDRAAGGKALAGWCDLFRAADGGTLFLDRVDQLDAELQAALLEWSRSGRPAAAADEAARDVRVIAGTEGSLEDAVAEGGFPAQLAEWLQLFRVALPPLSGHPEDIAAQARRALRAYQAGRERVALDFEPATLAALRRLPWEGNTRQLERAVRDALKGKGPGTLLRLDALPDEVRRAARELPPESETGAAPDDPYLEQTLEEYERRLLRSLGSGRADDFTLKWSRQ